MKGAGSEKGAVGEGRWRLAHTSCGPGAMRRTLRVRSAPPCALCAHRPHVNSRGSALRSPRRLHVVTLGHDATCCYVDSDFAVHRYGRCYAFRMRTCIYKASDSTTQVLHKAELTVGARPSALRVVGHHIAKYSSPQRLPQAARRPSPLFLHNTEQNIKKIVDTSLVQID